jgi:uncharacterized protein YbjQ (UPF0145 family)
MLGPCRQDVNGIAARRVMFCQELALEANAIVGLRKSNAHYEQAGSQWRMSRVTYQGTAVVVDRKMPSTESAA